MKPKTFGVRRAIECKGPDGSLAVATRQACYDGTYGTRTMHRLESFGQSEPVYDNKARALSAIYHGGQLKIFSHSVTQPNGPGTQPEYYMHPQRAFAMTDSKDSYVEGLTAIRNASDWADEQRNTAITLAKGQLENGIQVETEEDSDCEGESLSTMPSFAQSTMSSQVGDDFDGSEDELQRAFDNLHSPRPQEKRTPSNSRRSQRKYASSHPRRPQGRTHLIRTKL